MPLPYNMENPGNDRSNSPPRTVRPLQNEWGIYDPEQAGLAAVLRKLSIVDEVEVSDPSVSENVAK